MSTQLSEDGLEDSVQDSASYDESPRPPPPRSLRLDLQRPRSPQVGRVAFNDDNKYSGRRSCWCRRAHYSVCPR